MKFFFESISIKTEKSKNHTFRYKNLYSSPSQLKSLERCRPKMDFFGKSHKLILGNTWKTPEAWKNLRFFFNAILIKGLKIGWKKVHRKSFSVCLKKNSSKVISDGLKLLVWVTHEQFELDRWIRKLFIFKPRATVQVFTLIWWPQRCKNSSPMLTFALKKSRSKIIYCHNQLWKMEKMQKGLCWKSYALSFVSSFIIFF